VAGVDEAIAAGERKAFSDDEIRNGLQTLIAATGEKMWGTLPASVRHAIGTDDLKALAGYRVRFDATVEVSHDDPGFGFFSRPTHGEILAAPPAPEVAE
jgi:hypothetical protein